ncbi:MAG: tetratricopeptide repeat protein [Verrucomicrobia bacterium]|nr:tetratricopeptide repeat protein [Verrucomicrobiota bacterium]
MAKAPAPSQPEETAVPDPLAAALGPSPMEKFLQENKTAILGSLALVVVGVSAGIWFSGMREETRRETAEAFSKAESVSDFDALIAEYPGSPVAGNALLRKATLLEEEGKVDEARAALVELREKHPKHPLVDQATLSLARLAANANDLAKARDFLNEIPTTSDLAALAQLQLGDLAYREGDLVKAKTLYEPIQANYPVNPWSRDVAERLQALKLAEAKAKTPAPPKPAATAPAPAKPAAPAKPTAPAPAKPAAPAPIPAKPAAPAPVPASPPVPVKPPAPAPAVPPAAGSPVPPGAPPR